MARLGARKWSRLHRQPSGELGQRVAKAKDMAKAKGAKKWMQSAVKRPGEATRKAKAAGMSVQEWATAHQHDSGLTGQQARFAKTAKKISRRKK